MKKILDFGFWNSDFRYLIPFKEKTLGLYKNQSKWKH